MLKRIQIIQIHITFYLTFSDDVFITVHESCTGTNRKGSFELELDNKLLDQIIKNSPNENISNCSWIIFAPTNKTLNVTILDFGYIDPPTTIDFDFGFFGKRRRKRFFDGLVAEVDNFGEPESITQSPRFEPCDENFIRIFDGPSSDFPLLGSKICGDTGFAFTESSGSSVFVVLSLSTTSVLDVLKIGYSLNGKT